MNSQKFVVYARYNFDKTFYVSYDPGARKGHQVFWHDGLGDNVVYDTKEKAEKARDVCIQEVNEHWKDDTPEFVCYVSKLGDGEDY